MRASAMFAVLLASASCGPKVQPSWIETEAQLGTSHVGPGSAGASTAGRPAVVTIDPATLDAAAIDRLDEATVLTLLERIGDAAPAARLALRAARLAHHRGDTAEARALIARASGAADEPNVRGELAALSARVTAFTIDDKKIAVLLPLSGRFAAIGRELKAAIELAPAPGTRWLFLDTTGDAAAAVTAVEKADQAGAVAILGPVGQREAIAAARAASLHRIPIALLAPADGAEPSAGVFRLVDSPADEGREAARVAQQEGSPTVGVFAPRDDAAAEAAEAFVAAAERLGMQVTARGTYDPTGGNVEADVKAFLGMTPSNSRFAEHLQRAGKKAYTTFTPDIPYTLLYIPDRYDRAAIVAAFLPYYGVELRTTEFPDAQKLMRKHNGVMPQVVQLLGGAGWNHTSLPTVGGSAVQGALIVDGCAPEYGGDTGAQLSAELQQRTGAPASAVTAQAYDAATLVATARSTIGSSPDPRGAMRAALARARLDDGACGPAAMDVDGELKREAVVLEVAGSSLIVAP